MPSGRQPCPAHPLVVALDGRSGAGKTALADRLSAALTLRGRTCTVVHLDDLYPGWHGLSSALPVLCTEVLAPLRAGAAASYRSWDWHAGAPGPVRVVPTAAVVILEGVGAGAVPCPDLLDLVVWIEVEATQRRRRAVLRDGAALAEHWDDWAAQEEQVFARRGGPAGADVVLGEVDAATLDLLTARVEALLGPGGT